VSSALVLDRGGRPPKQNTGIMQNHRKVVRGESYLDLGSYRCRWPSKVIVADQSVIVERNLQEKCPL
jgi:hypothetical protein